MSAIQQEVFHGAGVFHAKGFIPIKTITALKAAGDWLYAALGAPKVSRGGAPGEADYLVSTNNAWGGLQMDAALDYLRAQNRPLQRGAVVAIDGAKTAVSAEFGDGWRWAPNGSFFRRLSRAASHVPWHTDAEAASTLRLGAKVITLWLPLIPVGEDAPSLEFVRGSQAAMQAPPAPMPEDRHRSDLWVKEAIGGQRWAPVATPGDALIFNEFTLHRTQPDVASAGRTAVELRFALPGAPRSAERGDVGAYRKSRLVERMISTIRWRRESFALPKI